MVIREMIFQGRTRRESLEKTGLKERGGERGVKGGRGRVCGLVSLSKKGERRSAEHYILK